MANFTTKANRHYAGRNTYILEVTNDKEVLGTVTIKDASNDVMAVIRTKLDFIYEHFYDGTSNHLYTRLIKWE